MRDKIATMETKRARQAKRFSPKFDIRALEAELRKENQHAISNDFHRRMDSGRIGTSERNTQK